MKNTNKTNCLCGNSESIVFACSGASDLGQISDLVARELHDNNVRKMNCLAVVGVGIEKSIEDFKTKNILVIDGCPVDCGKRIMEMNNITNFQYLRVTDLGLIKGQTPVNEEVIQLVYSKAEGLF